MVVLTFLEKDEKHLLKQASYVLSESYKVKVTVSLFLTVLIRIL